MSNAAKIADLDYSIAKATENISKATRLRLTGLAQQIRRERRAMQDARAELVNA